LIANPLLFGRKKKGLQMMKKVLLLS